MHNNIDFKILFNYQKRLNSLDKKALSIGLASFHPGFTLDYVNLILNTSKQKVEILTQLKFAIKAFNNMSIRNKKVIVLKYKLGLTSQAIAQHLNVGVRTIFRILKRCGETEAPTHSQNKLNP